MTQVVVADKSLMARWTIRRALERTPGITVIGEAQSASQILFQLERKHPQALVIGINLLSGQSPALMAAVMDRASVYTVVLADRSDPDQRELAGQALKAGAARILPPVPPPSAGDFSRTALQLSTALINPRRAPSRNREERRRSTDEHRPALSGELSRRPRVVALASSTGGPRALHELLAALTADFPLPILSVQHIAKGSVDEFVSVLAANCRIRVKLAEHGEPLVGATAYVAPDDWHLEVAQEHVDDAIKLSGALPVDRFRPSASNLFASVARRYGAGTVAVMLTGMGNDGLAGLVEVRRAGGLILTQDESSSANYGMPGAAADAGLSDVVLPLTDIAAYLMALV
jgi:two-component system, chemotaxis family, protein-glutamate methylesterase/glutaminase